MLRRTTPILPCASSARKVVLPVKRSFRRAGMNPRRGFYPLQPLKVDGEHKTIGIQSNRLPCTGPIVALSYSLSLVFATYFGKIVQMFKYTTYAG
jgi:hypothetical protein